MTYHLSNGAETFGPYDAAALGAWLSSLASPEGWWFWNGAEWRPLAEWREMPAATETPLANPLAELRPRLRACRRETNADGERLLSDIEGGGFLVLSPEDSLLVEELNGVTTIEELLRSEFARAGAPAGGRVHRLLVSLYRERLLDFAAEDEGRFLSAVAPGGKLGARRTTISLAKDIEIGRLRGLPLPFGFLGSTLASGFGIILGGLALLVTLLMFPFDPRIPLFMIRDSPALSFAWHFAAFSALVSLRNFARAGAARRFGRHPERWRFSLSPLWLAVDFDARELGSLSSSERSRVHRAALLFPLLVSAAAVPCFILDLDFAFWYRVGVDALVLLLISSAPFAGSDLAEWAECRAAFRRVKEHADAFFRSRFLRGLFDWRVSLADEGVLLTSASVALFWLYLVFSASSALLQPAVIPLAQAVVRPYSTGALLAFLDRAAALFWLAALLAPLGFVLTRIADLVIRLAPASWRERRPRSRSEGAGVDASHPALAHHVLFAGLSDADRSEILAAFRRILVPKGRAVFRQGEPGDAFYIVLSGSLSVIREHPTGLEEELARLRAGEAFGEQALLEDAPRNATVRAKQPCELARMDAEEFRRRIAGIPNLAESLTGILRALLLVRRIPALAGLSPEQVSQVTSHLRPVTVRRGETVIEEGARGDAVYFVREGVFGAFRRRERVGEVKAFEFFGEAALLHDEPRNASVIAESDGLLFRLDGELFRQLVFGSLGFQCAVERTLMARRPA